jgi:anthranilate phosphoribosyltransferase
MQAAHLIQRYPSALAGGQRPLTEGAAGVVSITPLLKRLWPAESAVFVTAEEIAAAVALIFTDQLSPVQTGALLTALHFTGLDRRADVLATCAAAMRRAAAAVDYDALSDVISRRGRKEGSYLGGLVHLHCTSSCGKTDGDSATSSERAVTATTPST